MNKLMGFTLIELLVVVTIIVVLLALLVPAMDKAIYQAELMVCGTKLKTMATGATLYAMDSKRFYPDRKVTGGGMYTFDLVHTDFSWGASNTSGVPWDDRPLLRSHIPLGTLQDPLRSKVDIEAFKPNQWVQTAYYTMWFAIHYPPNPTFPSVRHKPMRRVGDRFTWTEPDASQKPRTREYDLLGSDTDGNVNGTAYSSHPDDAGLLVDNYKSNAPTTTNPAEFWTFSYWYGSRGNVDLNYVHADGSVQRLNKVKGQNDERITNVPLFHDAQSWPTSRQQLPDP